MVEARTNEGANGRRVLRLALTALAIVAIGLLIWFTIDVFLLIFSGVLLAVLVRGIGRRIADHTPLNVTVSIFLGLAGLLLIFGGSLWFAGVQLIGQIDELARQLPAALAEIQRWASQQWWGPWVLERLPDEDLLRNAQEPTLMGLVETASLATSMVTYAVLITVFGIFLAIDPGVYLRGALYLAPQDRRASFREAAVAVQEALETYLLTKVVSMLVIGTLVTIGLWLMGVPLALQLGVLTGLLTFVPIIGQLLSMGLALALALVTGGVVQALLVAALYFAVQAADGYLLKPFFYRHALSFPPALTLGAQVLMGVLFGGFGVALASPLAISIWVLIRVLYVEGVLGVPITDDQVDDPPAATTHDPTAPEPAG